ncbi:hypothetical protein GQ42DRAFT_62291 [Ramicandelaber brevisporus]|nr:hypothetical protein GQ42DRAFT_62291 [Ramicandelaber brevisporus]
MRLSASSGTVSSEDRLLHLSNNNNSNNSNNNNGGDGSVIETDDDDSDDDMFPTQFVIKIPTLPVNHPPPPVATPAQRLIMSLFKQEADDCASQAAVHEAADCVTESDLLKERIRKMTSMARRELHVGNGFLLDGDPYDDGSRVSERLAPVLAAGYAPTIHRHALIARRGGERLSAANSTTAAATRAAYGNDGMRSSSSRLYSASANANAQANPHITMIQQTNTALPKPPSPHPMWLKHYNQQEHEHEREHEQEQLSSSRRLKVLNTNSPGGDEELPTLDSLNEDERETVDMIKFALEHDDYLNRDPNEQLSTVEDEDRRFHSQSMELLMQRMRFALGATPERFSTLVKIATKEANHS